MPDPNNKPALRSHYRAVRDGIPGHERAARTHRLRERVLGLPEVQRASGVFCYASAGSEAGTLGLIKALLEMGKTVAVPRVVEGVGLMRTVVITGVDVLGPGRFGVPTPVAGDAIDQPFDVTLVPGLAFTRDGRRLGQGGGYYDRYLARHPTTFAVGLCFSEQVADDLPTQPHDVVMSAVIDG